MQRRVFTFDTKKMEGIIKRNFISVTADNIRMWLDPIWSISQAYFSS